MKVLEKLANAEFLGVALLGEDSTYSCDRGLPPSCDCVCHQPCDFGYETSGEKSNTPNNEVYEVK